MYIGEETVSGLNGWDKMNLKFIETNLYIMNKLEMFLCKGIISVSISSVIKNIFIL